MHARIRIISMVLIMIIVRLDWSQSFTIVIGISRTNDEAVQSLVNQVLTFTFYCHFVDHMYIQLDIRYELLYHLSAHISAGRAAPGPLQLTGNASNEKCSCFVYASLSNISNERTADYKERGNTLKPGVVYNSSPPGQNGGKITDDKFKFNIVNENWFVSTFFHRILFLGWLISNHWFR